MSYIYAIEAETGLIKIGHTRELRSRLSELRANNCAALKPLGYARGTREQEADLHRLLASEHVRGEWFRRGPLVNHCLSLFAPWPLPEPRLRFQSASTPADEIVARFGGKKALAAILNISPDAVKQWRLRGDIPGKWHIQLLREARNRGINLSASDLIREIAA